LRQFLPDARQELPIEGGNCRSIANRASARLVKMPIKTMPVAGSRVVVRKLLVTFSGKTPPAAKTASEPEKRRTDRYGNE
jgi:hypothetical protein